MNYIFSFLILGGILVAFLNGRMDVILNAAVTSAEAAVERAISLIAVISLWLGIARVAEKAGLIDIMSR
ncbi:MAG: spore maturation protein, partial [Thermoanaerobacteraceae bacterium]|nr:spore maturation protein [Thermoanaerobacteraceae bacterium]